MFFFECANNPCTIFVQHAKHQGRITKRSVLKQRKEKERRKDTAMSSKLLWHLQNLRGNVCTRKLFVFQPQIIHSYASMLFGNCVVPKNVAGQAIVTWNRCLPPASCTLCQVFEKKERRSNLDRVELRSQTYFWHIVALVHMDFQALLLTGALDRYNHHVEGISFWFYPWWVMSFSTSLIYIWHMILEKWSRHDPFSKIMSHLRAFSLNWWMSSRQDYTLAKLILQEIMLVKWIKIHFMSFMK